MSKKVVTIAMMFVGLAAILTGMLLLGDESVKVLSGTCLGVGAGLLGMSASHLMLQGWYKKHPKEQRQSKIDSEDERNRAIQNKAKAKCADILQWFVMGLAWVSILAGFPLWFTLVVVGVFVLKSGLEFYFMHKLEKEM